MTNSDLQKFLRDWVSENKVSLSKQGIDIAPEEAETNITIYAQSQPPSLWLDDDADDDDYIDIMGRLTLGADGNIDVELFDGDSMDGIHEEHGKASDADELTSKILKFIEKLRKSAKLDG